MLPNLEYSLVRVQSLKAVMCPKPMMRLVQVRQRADSTPEQILNKRLCPGNAYPRVICSLLKNDEGNSNGSRFVLGKGVSFRT